MRQDLDGLQGTWNIVSLEMDGQKMPGAGARIVVRGDRFTTIAMGATYEGTVAVHQATAPKSLAITSLNSSKDSDSLCAIGVPRDAT